jgi:hypothetical protein
MIPRSVVLLAAITASILASSAAHAQPQASHPTPIEKGRTDVGLLVGVGRAMDVWGGLPDSQFLTLGLNVGRVVTAPIFAGPCRGNLAFSAQVHPAILFRESTGTTYAASAAGLARYYFAPESRIRPFLSAGGGIVLSARGIPRGISRLNFTPQGGAGLAFGLRGMVLTTEYRIHHMSDGSRTDYNPGANSSEIQIGLSWFR